MCGLACPPPALRVRIEGRQGRAGGRAILRRVYYLINRVIIAAMLLAQLSHPDLPPLLSKPISSLSVLTISLATSRLTLVPTSPLQIFYLNLLIEELLTQRRPLAARPLAAEPLVIEVVRPLLLFLVVEEANLRAACMSARRAGTASVRRSNTAAGKAARGRRTGNGAAGTSRTGTLGFQSISPLPSGPRPSDFRVN